MNIKHFHSNEPGDLFSYEQVDPPEIPEWLNVHHPKFPKYFDITVFNKYGATVACWKRHPNLPPIEAL